MTLQKASELFAEITKLKHLACSGECATLSLAETVLLVDPEFQPKVIDISGSSDETPLILLRPQGMPAVAFLCWNDRGTYSQWQLRLNIDGKPSGEYGVLCACPCSSSIYGYNYSSEDSQEKCHVFRQRLVEAHVTHKFSMLFVRRAHAWDERFGAIKGVTVRDADDAFKPEVVNHTPAAIKKALGFIHPLSRMDQPWRA